MKMMTRRILLQFLPWVLLICSSMAGCPAPLLKTPHESPLMASSRQLVVVRTADWGAFMGTLQRYERDPVAGHWDAVGAITPVVVGRNGLAWGIGLSDQRVDNDVPVKLEGDGKAPAGVFNLGPAFGYESPSTVPWVQMSYVQSDIVYKCIDDDTSRHYNTLVFDDETEKDWKSSEDMLRGDELYRLGVVVQHNWAARTKRGRGSCIFLHIWLTPDEGTAGCTAMRDADMVQLLMWLDSLMNPILVQLPESEYARFRGSWQLP